MTNQEVIILAKAKGLKVEVEHTLEPASQVWEIKGGPKEKQKRVTIAFDLDAPEEVLSAGIASAISVLKRVLDEQSRATLTVNS